MRKLILITLLLMNAYALRAQSNASNAQPNLYFRLGAGYGYRNIDLPRATTAAEKNHFENLRHGRSYNLTLGYNVAENRAVAITYQRYQTRQETTDGSMNWNTKLSVSFGGITYQQFIPIGEKRDVNFNYLIGPGLLFYRNDYTKKNGSTTVARSDVNRSVFGAIGGAGIDMKVVSGIRWELNASYTIGSINETNLKENLNAFMLTTGFRFEF